jgi:voltage-gated potassium channel
MKERIHKILSVSKNRGDLSWYVDIFIIVLISLNVAAIIAESVESVRQTYGILFYWFEIFSVLIFTVEYILRVWTANCIPKYKKPFSGNVKFIFSPLAIIDLLAILPFYLPFVGIDLRLLRMLRIFRIFRLFKIARYVEALSFIRKVFKRKKEELVISLIFTLFLLLVASSLMYYVENESQPDHFSSIPETMWWGIATLTTVGYGDVYPITPSGKILGGVIAVIGIGLFALPTGILASGFSDEISGKKRKGKRCQECNRPL